MTISENVQNIFMGVIQDNALDTKNALDAALRDKIHTALEAKKVEIAQTLVGKSNSVDEMYKKNLGTTHINDPDKPAARVKGIVKKKGMDKDAVGHILFNQGYGRKSLNKVTDKESGGALVKKGD